VFYEGVISLEQALREDRLPALETFDAPKSTASGQSGLIRIVFPEFTCVCPKTGYPDFATIALVYLPDKLCVELKSWKLYLNSFRMVGTFHEALTAHLFDLVNGVLAPRWLLLIGDFLPRGNVDTTVLLESSTPRPAGADLLLAGLLTPRCRGLIRESGSTVEGDQ
jgi:7-cyano-7-deazaguanine reductase